MAASGRVYIGVFVFALIATLAIVPLTAMILTGYTPPPAFPMATTKTYSLGDKVAFSMASITSVLLTVAAWQMLVQGARRRQLLVQARRQSQEAIEVGGDGGRGPDVRREGDDPPGYG